MLHFQFDVPALGQTMVWSRLRSMGSSVTLWESMKCYLYNWSIVKLIVCLACGIWVRNMRYCMSAIIFFILDSHHKLIRWEMGTHYAIDRYTYISSVHTTNLPMISMSTNIYTPGCGPLLQKKSICCWDIDTRWNTAKLFELLLEYIAKGAILNYSQWPSGTWVLKEHINLLHSLQKVQRVMQ